MNTEKMHKTGVTCFILLLSLLPYLINLNSFWVMDDATQVERGTAVSWHKLFHDPYNKPEHFFRPLSIALSMMDGKIWGINAWGYRLTNYVLFFLCGLLVYRLARLFSSHHLALLSALIFLIHPIQVGTVVWLTGRVDILPSFFLLASAIVFLRDEKKPMLASLLGCAIFVFALLSKETALLFPLALFAGFIARGRPLAQALLKILPAFAISVLYVVLRVTFNYLPGTNYYDPSKVLADPILMIRNFLAFALNTIYLFIPLWNPFDVLKKDFPSADSLMKLLFNAQTAPVIFFIVVCTLLIVWFIWKGALKMPSRRPLLFAFVWFIAFLVPTFHVLGNMGGTRYFFAPSVGVFMAITLLGTQIRARISVKVFDSIIVSFLTLCLIMNIREQLAWKNAFDTAERITLKVIEHARTIPPYKTLLVYDLPEYSSSGKLVYPKWDEYSLPMSVKLLSGLSVIATHSKPVCKGEEVICVSAKE